MGQWLVTTPTKARELSTTSVASQTVTVPLPRSNFLSRVTGTLHAIGSAANNLVITRIKVLAAGSATFWDSEGGQLRGINKFQNGTVNAGALVAASDSVWPFTINFGRFYRDTRLMFPAKLFKQLDLQITYQATSAITRVVLTLTTDEYVSNMRPQDVLIRRVGIVQTVASAANLRSSVRLNLGPALRAIYVHTDDPDNVNGNTPTFGGTVVSPDDLIVKVNGGAELPFSAPLGQVKYSNQEFYRFDNGDTPDAELANGYSFAGTEEMVCIDFDALDDLNHMINTAGMNDLTLDFVAAASGTSGDTHVIVDEVLPVVA